MKLITSIVRIGREQRGPGSTRKRPSRSFASTFAALEGRALLSVVGPISATPPTITSTTSALIEAISIPTPTPRPSQPGHGPNGGGQGGSNGGSNGGHSNPTTNPGDRVSMDAARVVVGGQSTPEFALADFNSSEVFVRLGFGSPPVELGPADGVDHPGSVTLADLDGDGIPELIVANTNGNNVLVFPGLPGGQFGPEEGGGQGFAVGRDPINVTVNYVDGSPEKAQLIVANAESNNVTILDGQATPGGWTATSTSTIATLSTPVKTLLFDMTGDGNADLLVCNRGSDQVTIYQGLGGGLYAPDAIATLNVGTDPDAMFVGQFDRRPGPDLVTVNAGSNDLTFLGDVFGPHSTSQTISSQGTSPDAAFAVDSGHAGVLDLVVANGGDGRLAVFRGGSDSLQLAGVITQANIPSPTALAPASFRGDEIDFYAAGAGDDAAMLLRFDLGVASAYLPGNSTDPAVLGQGDGELFGQLTPLEGSSLELIAILWAGSPDFDAVAASNLRDPSGVTALYSPTEGQGGEPTVRLSEGWGEASIPMPGPADPSKVAGDRLANAISGAVEALGRPRGTVGAIASRDALDEEDGRPLDGLARLDLDRAPVDPDVETTSGVLDEIIRRHRPEGPAREWLAPVASPPKFDPLPGFDGAEAVTPEGQFEAVPLLSTALVLSSRLILNASTPRPPGVRAMSWFRRFVSLGHDRRPGTRPDLL